MKTLGDKIKELLQLNDDMKQKELSILSGVSQAVISDLVKNKTENAQLDTIQRLAKALKVHPAYFIETDTLGPADIIYHLTEEDRDFILQSDSLPWLKLSRDAAQKGVSPETVKKVIDIIRQDFVDK